MTTRNILLRHEEYDESGKPWEVNWLLTCDGAKVSLQRIPAVGWTQKPDAEFWLN